MLEEFFSHLQCIFAGALFPVGPIDDIDDLLILFDKPKAHLI